MFSKPETEHFLHQSIVYKQDFAGKCLQVFLKEKIFSSDQQKKRLLVWFTASYYARATWHHYGHKLIFLRELSNATSSTFDTFLINRTMLCKLHHSKFLFTWSLDWESVLCQVT